jgi:hypothetical protein
MSILEKDPCDAEKSMYCMVVGCSILYMAIMPIWFNVCSSSEDFLLIFAWMTYLLVKVGYSGLPLYTIQGVSVLLVLFFNVCVHTLRF